MSIRWDDTSARAVACGERANRRRRCTARIVPGSAVEQARNCHVGKPHVALCNMQYRIILHSVPVFKPVFLLSGEKFRLRSKTNHQANCSKDSHKRICCCIQKRYTGVYTGWPVCRRRRKDGIVMKKFKVGVVGATGMVGQRFITLLVNHPWFELTTLAASARSAGKRYEDAVGGRWLMQTPMPEQVKDMIVLDASHVEEVASQVDFVFCAVNMKKDEIKALEEAYAKAECPVVSNNSAHRFTPDVPMVVPEINAEHIEIIPAQRRRLGTKRGFIAVKSNCSLQSYVPALHPLRKYGITKCLVCTYQAISGAGKTFETFPDILDNVIPYIGGEEEKSEQEPLKLWGHIEGDKIVPATTPSFTAQCLRVPVSDGHMGAVFVSFEHTPTKEEILKDWAEFHGPAQDLELPSAPKQFLHYFTEDDRPQPKLDRMLENGMAVSIGRLRPDTQYDYKFVCLSHNTLRGAAGGAVLLAELLAKKGYLD